MEGLSKEDSERLLTAEHARRTAEIAYAKNPGDAENLTAWGAALLEVASFRQPAVAMNYVRDAQSKLEEALEIDPRKHETLWNLANAYTTHALYTQDDEVANGFFEKASLYLQRALNEDPANDLYLKSLQLSYKAPQLRLELHREMASRSAAAAGTSASNVQVSQKQEGGDGYDMLGWVILAVGIIAWGCMANFRAPSHPSR